MRCLGEKGGSWKKQAEQQEGALPGYDVPSWVEDREADEAEVTGEELGNVLVSGISGLVAGLVSLRTEVLLVDVTGVV